MIYGGYMKNKIVPWLMTAWVVFVMAMYCKVFIIPRLIEFIIR